MGGPRLGEHWLAVDRLRAVYRFGWTAWLQDGQGNEVARRRYRTEEQALADFHRLAAAVRVQGPAGVA